MTSIRDAAHQCPATPGRGCETCASGVSSAQGMSATHPGSDQQANQTVLLRRHTTPQWTGIVRTSRPDSSRTSISGHRSTRCLLKSVALSRWLTPSNGDLVEVCMVLAVVVVQKQAITVSHMEKVAGHRKSLSGRRTDKPPCGDLVPWRKRTLLRWVVTQLRNAG